MIAFDCENCGKALMLPDSKAGTLHTCPGCSFGMVVPPPPERSVLSQVPWVKLSFLVLFVSVGLLWWAYRGYQANRNNIVKQQFQSVLQNHNPQWTSIDWLACDVRRGEFKVTAYFPAPSGSTYACEAISLSNGTQTSVRINPSEEGSLAVAFISGGQMRTFDYNGQMPAERELLHNLALDLDSALSAAVKLVQDK